MFKMLNAQLFVFQLNFLVQKEILSAKSTRLRADVLAHFIKVAKVRLYQNLTGMILQNLQSRCKMWL